MPRFSNRPFLATTLSFLSSRAKPSGSAVRHSCASLLPAYNRHQSQLEIPGSEAEGSAVPLTWKPGMTKGRFHEDLVMIGGRL